MSDKGWDIIVAVPRWAHTVGDGMKKFATELRGKTVMTNDGQILGTIENFIVNTKSGKLSDVLVAPAENVPTKGLKTDPEGRIVLPFTGMRAVKDVVVMNL
jgi:sporulation protein YlmC with PRC-barrel domain